MGEEVRRELYLRGLFRLDVAPKAEGKWLFLPVVPKRAGEVSDMGFSIESVELRPIERKPTATELLGFSPSYETVGDIAIAAIGSPPEVGEALLKAHPHLKTVLLPTGSVEGEFRTRSFTLMAGEDRRATLHRENGLRMRVDLEAAYFSPRLATERMRVSRQVKKHEVVVDMFAGVGPFTLLLAKRAKRVYAADLNPRAVELLEENVALNRLENVEVFLADAAKLELPEECDRAVMNLPHGAAGYLQDAVRLLGNSGTIHFYCIGPQKSPYGEGELAVEEAARKPGVEIVVAGRRIVHSYAPRVYLVVLDLVAGKA